MPPLTDEARQRARQPPSGLGRGVSSNVNPVGPFDSYEDLGLYDRCITRGIPSSMMPAGYGSFYEIIQGQESVALRYEMIHEHRVVPIDRGERRPHIGERPAPRPRRRAGLVRGQHAGRRDDELHRAQRVPRGQRAPEDDRAIHPIAPAVVEWRVTFDDPHTWTRPWTFAMILKQTTHGEKLYEYACHEGNYGLKNILTGARAADSAAAAGR